MAEGSPSPLKTEPPQPREIEVLGVNNDFWLRLAKVETLLDEAKEILRELKEE